MIQPYKIFEERRKYPRVAVATQVAIFHGDNRIEAGIHDVSADGVQVRCDRKSFQAIHPSGRYIRKNNAPVVDTRFTLKINNQLEEINVRGLVYYFVVLPEGGKRDIAFGLRFISQDDHTIASINAFIEAAMRPDDDPRLHIMKEPESIAELHQNAEMNSYEQKTTLLDMLERYDVPVPESAEHDRYQCLSTCIETLFEKIGEIENRIYRLEEKLTD